MGQPMQVHAVPLEDRAFDSQGRRLPYAKEWPESVFTQHSVLLVLNKVQRTSACTRTEAACRGERPFW